MNIGDGTMLNVFQVEGNAEAERQVPMFGRGRIDHIGLEPRTCSRSRRFVTG